MLSARGGQVSFTSVSLAIQISVFTKMHVAVTERTFLTEITIGNSLGFVEKSFFD